MSAALKLVDRPRRRDPLTEAELIKLTTGALRSDYSADRNGRGALADDAGTSPESAKNWHDGRHALSLLSFVNLIRSGNCPELAAMARALLGFEGELAPTFQRDFAQLLTTLMRDHPEILGSIEIKRAELELAKEGEA